VKSNYNHTLRLIIDIILCMLAVWLLIKLLET
jgi:hypothetical protein